MSRAEKAKGAELSAPANTRAEDSATFTDDRISCYPPEVNGANSEAERDIDGTDEFMLGIYLGHLKNGNEKFVFDYSDPDGALEIHHASSLFSEGESLFKDVRQFLRKHGRNGLVEEIKDLRAEREKLLDEIKEMWLQPIASDDGEWHGVFADICPVWDKSSGINHAYVRDEVMSGNIKHTFRHTNEQALANTAGLLEPFIDKYNALLDEEAQFVDTALANLRGWKSATGDDVRELKPEIVRGANAAESADANAAAAKTAAEGAKESAEGAEQVAKKTAAEVKGLKPEVEAAHEAADDAKIAAEGAKRSAEGAIEAAYEAQTAAEGAKDITQDFFNSRPYDYECSTEMLADFLKQKGVGKCSRTIQYWENYLAQGKGRKVKSPDKYTLLTRQTIAGAKAWVEYYAAHEKSKCRARESYDEISARHNASRIADNAPKPRRGE